MAPEKINCDICTEKADIWALGVVIYKMCSFNFPFDADNIISLQETILQCLIPKRIPEISSGELWNLIQQLLSKYPDDRPSSLDLLEIKHIDQYLSSIKNDNI